MLLLPASPPPPGSSRWRYREERPWIPCNSYCACFVISSILLQCGHNVLRFLDKHKTFHKYIAYMICLQTGMFINDPFVKISITCVLPSGSAATRGHFRVHFSLYFKASLRAEPLLWISVLSHLELEVITIAKISHLDSPRKRDRGKLGDSPLGRF